MHDNSVGLHFYTSSSYLINIIIIIFLFFFFFFSIILFYFLKMTGFSYNESGRMKIVATAA